MNAKKQYAVLFLFLLSFYCPIRLRYGREGARPPLNRDGGQMRVGTRFFNPDLKPFASHPYSLIYLITKVQFFVYNVFIKKYGGVYAKRRSYQAQRDADCPY